MLDIFATDPEAARARQEREEKIEAARGNRPTFNFQLRSGKRVGRQPVSLKTWRITTPHKEVLDALKELFGGTVEEAPNGDYALDTDREYIEVILDPRKIEAKLIQWADGLPIHECDGQTSLLKEDEGQPCGCPPLLADKKERAKQRRGPKPNIVIPFLLPQDVDLGTGKYTATAWSFAEDLPFVMKRMEKISGDVLCRLRLEHVEYTTQAGEKREFTKPVLEVVGSYNDAIADDPEPDF